MRTICCLILLVAVAIASDNKRYYDLKDAPALFEKFMREYDRHYKDEADKQAHYEAFVQNLDNINKMNKVDPTATHGINFLADYTEKERNNLYGELPLPENQRN